jgi:K+-sensing histidine kinase KdpD
MTSINAALQLANLQAGEPVATAPVDLGYILARTGISVSDSFSGECQMSDASRTQPCLVLGNEELLRQSVTTLLRAAQRMATTGTRPECRIDVKENLAVLRISFGGRQLSIELLDSFFDTFSYHRACSYVEDLGLAVPLAAELVRSMGGSVDLRRTPSGGEIILILLKATQGS